MCYLNLLGSKIFCLSKNQETLPGLKCTSTFLEIEDLINTQHFKYTEKIVYLEDPQMYHKMRNLRGPGLSRSKMIKKIKLQTKKKF